MGRPFTSGSPAGGEPADPGPGSRRAPAPRTVALVVGGLTGLLSLTAMVRLTDGAFADGMSRFAWAVVLAAMLPWVAYVAVRARHGRLSLPGLVAVVIFVVVGFVAVLLPVHGPVLALACSLAGFAVVWVSDWPQRRPEGEDRFVRVEQLQHEDLDGS